MDTRARDIFIHKVSGMMERRGFACAVHWDRPFEGLLRFTDAATGNPVCDLVVRNHIPITMAVARPSDEVHYGVAYEVVEGRLKSAEDRFFEVASYGLADAGPVLRALAKEAHRFRGIPLPEEPAPEPAEAIAARHLHGALTELAGMSGMPTILAEVLQDTLGTEALEAVTKALDARMEEFRAPGAAPLSL